MAIRINEEFNYMKMQKPKAFAFNPRQVTQAGKESSENFYEDLSPGDPEDQSSLLCHNLHASLATAIMLLPNSV
ncbi:MAG: hypothetical protein M1829_006291 [Trizodia sp. TS-e1964]|nr:MAG: hypothetical protein M1829_006291 [Trizodia sp. TS-e1964]